MLDRAAQTYALPECLRIPIAAATVAAIQKYVGRVVDTRPVGGAPSALLVVPYARELCKLGCAPLWSEPGAAGYEDRLHPCKQVWVHVDLKGYRNAYKAFGMPDLPEGAVLDHIQNRKAVRLRNNSHPFLRLSPISSAVNTNSGVDSGAEGLEREYLGHVRDLPADERETVSALLQRSEIIYASPAEITKMLDIPLGTQVLDGVRDAQRLYYRRAALEP